MFKISDFQNILSGIPFHYNQDFEFYSTAPSEDASHHQLLFFISNEKYLKNLEKHPYNIGGIICNKDVAKALQNDFNVVVCDNPDKLFWEIQNNMQYENDFDTKWEEDCYISNKAIIPEKNVCIGKNVIIEDYVVIKENVIIGDNSTIRSGSIIGGEGFLIFRDKISEEVKSIKHFGKVVIGNNVDIHYNSCIDKALYRHMSTIIEDNCRIENLVHIAHNAHLKKGVFVAAGAILAGSIVIGEGTFVGINSCTRQFVEVGKNSLIGMGGAVIFNVEDNCTVATMPARKI